MISGSSPLMQAAVASTNPAAAPEQTYAASLRVSSAMRRPTAVCN